MRKVDKKDRQILLQLDRDSRQTYTEIAKRIGIPPETVRYRIKNLERHGVIQNYLAVIDGGKLGYYYYKVFFKLHNVDETRVQEIIHFLSQDPNICWVVRVDELFDIAFTPRVSDPIEQSRLMDSLRKRFSEFLLRWTLSINISMDFLTRDYLIRSKRKPEPRGSYTAKKEVAKLDRESRAVLQAVAEDPRATAAEIASRLTLAPHTVQHRIKTLERSNLIVRYSLVLDNSALQQVNFYVLLYLSELSDEREKALQDFCRAQPNIVYIIKSLGEWDYELSIEADSVETYRTLMMELNSAFSDIIKHSTGLSVRRIHKYIYP